MPNPKRRTPDLTSVGAPSPLGKLALLLGGSAATSAALSVRSLRRRG